MTNRAQRHPAMVDFQQHQQRLWVVPEEDHEKVEKRAKQLEELLRIAYEHGRYRRLSDDELGRIGAALSNHSEEALDMVQAALSPENQRIVPVEPFLAQEHPMAATPSEDGREVPEVVGWCVYNPRTKKTRFYGASKGYLMEGFQNVGYQTEAVTTVAQHSRIVAAKDAEIAAMRAERKPKCLRDQKYDENLDGPCSAGQCKWPDCKAVVAQPARQVGGEIKIPWGIARQLGGGELPCVCKECGSKDLAWFTNNVTYSGVQNGRLKTNEVTCLFVLGCNECSATVAMRKADWFADRMNAALAPAAVVMPESSPCDVMDSTGNTEVDRIIGRLMSADPDFNDCTDAAMLLRRLVIEEINGPSGYSTWKDAATAERIKRVAMKPREEIVSLARDGIDIYPGPNMNERKLCDEIIRLDAAYSSDSKLDEVARLNAHPVSKAELEALRRDAGRYRFLRLRIATSQLRVLGAECTSDTVEGVDAGIDTAIAQQQEGGKA